MLTKDHIAPDLFHQPGTLPTYNPISSHFNSALLPQQPWQADQTSLCCSYLDFHPVRHRVYNCGIFAMQVPFRLRSNSPVSVQWL